MAGWNFCGKMRRKHHGEKRFVPSKQINLFLKPKFPSKKVN